MADVLVIDSDEGSFGPLVPALNDAGHSVRVARTGAGGLVGSRTQRPDLVLLEGLLPDISGMEVCRSLKSDEATREACVIFLSSKNGDADRVSALELGADDYVAKPCSIREIVLRVNAVLRRAERHGGKGAVVGPLSLARAAPRVFVHGRGQSPEEMQSHVVARLFAPSATRRRRWLPRAAKSFEIQRATLLASCSRSRTPGFCMPL